MNQTPEEVFYARQQSFLEPAKATADTERLFRPGGRYGIIAESLSLEPSRHSELLVELGCGKGDTLMYAKQKFGFRNAVGVDLCFSQAIANEAEGYQFFSANLNQAWPIQEGHADVLIAMMLLEHLFDPYASFREIKRVLKPSGRAFVNLPLVTSIKNRLRLLTGRMPVTSVPYERWQREGHWDGFHLHYFTLSAIHDLAASSGLRVTKGRSVGRFRRIKDRLPSLLCDEISFELRQGAQ